MGDPYKLEQVVRNFIGNAVKFTPTKGKISVTVTITMNVKNQSYVSADDDPISKNGTLRLSVVDTGAGISFENQSKLFQQYIQFNAGKLQGGKGSGLGLWISKTIIDMHEGKVGAYSGGEGRGSTFYFELPCQVFSPNTFDDMFPSTEEVPTATTQVLDGNNDNKNKLAVIIPTDLSKDIPPAGAIIPDLSRTTSTVVVGYDSAESEKTSSLETIKFSESKKDCLTAPNPFLSGLASPRSFLILNRNFSSSRSISSSSDRSPFLENTAKRLKILLADDSALTRKMVQRLLTPLNPIICHASNGVEAVNMVLHSMQPEERMFDVVVIDFLMPEMDGGEAIYKMREQKFDGLVCAVTGSTSQVDQERLISNGASMIMGKPFNYKTFYNCLRGIKYYVIFLRSLITLLISIVA